MWIATAAGTVLNVSSHILVLSKKTDKRMRMLDVWYLPFYSFKISQYPPKVALPPLWIYPLLFKTFNIFCTADSFISKIVLNSFRPIDLFDFIKAKTFLCLSVNTSIWPPVWPPFWPPLVPSADNQNSTFVKLVPCSKTGLCLYKVSSLLPFYQSRNQHFQLSWRSGKV